MDLKNIGKIIRERRAFLDVKQSDLAEISGVAIKTIYAIESGKANPSAETLIKLLRVLGMEINIQIRKNL
jgi:transcriptional regulator with XRE-family HTH domain